MATRQSIIMDQKKISLGERPLRNRSGPLIIPISTVSLGFDRPVLLQYGLAFSKTIFEHERRGREGVFTHNTHHHVLLNTSPFGLHTGIFIPTLTLLASDEQLTYWLPLAEGGKIISLGTYCHTGPGHGTFLLTSTNDGRRFPRSRCPAGGFPPLRRTSARLSGEAQKVGITPGDAWNAHMLSLIAAAHAHMEYFVLYTFVLRVPGISIESLEIGRVLLHLSSIFACGAIAYPSPATAALGFIMDGHLAHSQLSDVRALVAELLEELVPDAVALSDAWVFSDASLQSALGRADGDVYYKAMLRWTRQLPTLIR
ncbi:acyl-CoA dehydrogenase/oxidase C-terminal [Mycena vulgaris]|nr:acyl-CoA dehydrogenase/oxidase C-terminal [Mycena vulgaris]